MTCDVAIPGAIDASTSKAQYYIWHGLITRCAPTASGIVGKKGTTKRKARTKNPTVQFTQ